MRIKIFILSVGLLTSCADESDSMKSMNDPGVPIHVLIDSIENHGSVLALEKLQAASLITGLENFFPPNPTACRMVYMKLMWMYNVPVIDSSENGIYNLETLNHDSRVMAVKYLSKAALLGDMEANRQLSYLC